MSIKEFWDKYNPFDIGYVIEQLTTNFTDVKNSLEHIEHKIDIQLNSLENSLVFQKALVTAISETVPDMIWLKDLNGKYMYANKAIKDGLLFTDNPIGRTDLDISMKAKAQFGPDNHTFGEVCGNSDLVVIETLIAQRFLESGKIKGKEFYLEVFKAPFYMDDELVGICGVGRDLTEYIETYRASHCSKCSLTENKDIFSKFAF